ncbi:MAG: cytochrome c3 family protein [Armatimonadota bacterium]
MIKKSLTGLIVLVMALVAGGAMAGDYHTGATLVCSDCHTMHYSLQHDFNGGPAPTLGAGGPFDALLIAEPNDLCLQCHDGQTWAPDVLETNTNSDIRQAGALNEIGGGAPYQEWKGHTLGSQDAPPGQTVASAYNGTDGLKCVSCHMQHGGTTYRNLSTRINSTPVTVTYATGTNDTTKDVFESASSGVNHYDTSNINFNEPDITDSKYANWCKNCHTNFHGKAGDTTTVGGTGTGADAGHFWLRHPTAGVNIAGQPPHGHSGASSWKRATKVNFAKVMDPAGLWDHANDPTTNDGVAAKGYTPSCFSCHKAHGNQNAFGLIQMGITGTVTEEGTGGATTAKTLCNQCHGQGYVAP